MYEHVTTLSHLRIMCLRNRHHDDITGKKRAGSFAFGCLITYVLRFIVWAAEPSENVPFDMCAPAKIQSRLRIRAVCSKSSLGAFEIAKDAKFVYAD